MMGTHWRIEDVSEGELEKLGCWISLILKRGDVLLLEGDLGAGKTTFARALIGAVSDNQIDEIPSPTFSLVQHYETARAEIFHFDLYRITQPDEVHEIGLDAALAEGVTLIEWPDRLAAPPTADYLKIHLEEAKAPDERQLTLSGLGSWAARLKRLENIIRFVEKSGWSAAPPVYMQGDASARAYARLENSGRGAILMNAPAGSDGPPVRDGKPYSRIAHLSEDVRAFVAIATHLRAAGFHAPEIYASDLDEGFLILEDMGAGVFGDEIANGRPMGDLYRPAVELLIELRKHDVPDELPVSGAAAYHLPKFDAGAFLIEAELLIDWYWPALKSEPVAGDKRTEFQGLFGAAYARIEGRDVGWTLRDFHSPNLIWLGDDAQAGSIKDVGIIDFQDALEGPRSYDLVSLLQDARLDVPESLEADLLNHYCREASKQSARFDADEFRLSYAIFGVQRNTKILGIFARLAMRDKKYAYLSHMPRIWKYLERNLRHPELIGLKHWFDSNLPKDLRKRSIDADRIT